MNYIFRTKAAMKEHNKKNWWIDRDIISEKRITADSVEKALEIYRERVKEENYVDISKNAIKNKSPMFVDTTDGAKQVGYVITAKADFENNEYKWSQQYIDLWIDILTIIETSF